MFWMVLIDLAMGGKLAEGFQWIPYGDVARFANKPLPNCSKPSDHSNLLWLCEHKLGNAPVQVMFIVREGLYLGFTISTKGYGDCLEMLSTIDAAYGTGTMANDFATGALDERTWLDGDASGSFEYSLFTEECSFTAFSMSVHAQAKKKQEERAKKSVDGL